MTVVLRGGVYGVVVKPVLLCGAETWAAARGQGGTIGGDWDEFKLLGGCAK